MQKWYVYDFYDSNAVYTVAEYQRLLPNWRITNLRVFGVCQTFLGTGYFSAFALQLSPKLV
jgi:hypothetical protein